MPQLMGEDRAPAGYRAALHRYAVATACATFLLIIAGALVTSQDAGLSVPDWPLSYGKLMPPMSGGIFYEHGHRMVATFVGLLTIGLAVWLWRKEPRRWLRRLGLVALAAVILQGVLGGITVLLLLPWPVSVGHASLAQLFFCLTVCVALFTSKGWQQEAVRRAGPSPLPRLTLLTAGAVFAQLVLGAALRHKAIGVTPHILWALAVAMIAVGTVRGVLSTYEVAALRYPALALGCLVVLQLGLGLSAYLARLAAADAPQPLPWVVGLTVAHVAAGALTLAASVVLALQAHRLLEPGNRIAGTLPALGKTHP